MPDLIIQSFKNDYNQTGHPDVLQALARTGAAHYAGYGLDSISLRTTDMLREHCQCPQADVHFLAGGTLTNLLAISSMLRPHQAVIAASSGHIEIHETGAVEATGHKILTPQGNNSDGKLTPQHICALCDEHDNEHMVQPRLVYVSQATELGTAYTTQELTAISQVCKERGLYYFIDGARIGAAVTCAQGTQPAPSLAEIAALCDAFYIGGTKNGALFGEALVLVNEAIQQDFRYLCKQRGAMLAKGWLISAQFEALFAKGLYYELAAHANTLAQYLTAGLIQQNIPLLLPTQTNQIFPILPTHAVERLAQTHAFETWARHAQTQTIRFVTSWSTTQEEVDVLLRTVAAAYGRSA